MKGGEITKRLFVILSFCVVIICTLPNAKVFAATGGMLNGKTMTVGNYSTLVASETTTLATDNDFSTFYSLTGMGTSKDSLYYTFDTPVTIGTVYANLLAPSNYYYIVMYNEAGTQIYYNGFANSTRTITVNKTGVKKVLLFNPTTGASSLMKVYEFDVFTGTPDTIPPSVPTGLTANSQDRAITVNWNANSESDLDHYVVKVGASLISVGTNTATVTGLTNGTTYAVSVKAVDRYGNESAFSSSVNATPLGPSPSPTPTPTPPPDITPPAKPIGLSGRGGDKQAILTWTANTETDLSKYNVYQNGTKVTSSISAAATITGLTNGTTYNFAVSAVDSSGNESARSNPVTVTPSDRIDVVVIPNMDSLVLQISGGTRPYHVNWGSGSADVNSTQYVIQGLIADKDYTVTVTDDAGLTWTATVNTGHEKGYIPPTMPNPQQMFQRMLDVFGTAGTIAVAIIGGALLLGIMVVLARWGWILLKGWLAKSK